ncbi:hypothetical protein PPL_09796 [Heterostelium album PN500]|uniref:IPT/TIG domain-containing protein n=1 Tax=Heterostelium pallidum (strain ATCC 26659 / Pp 5 / PN500) TaxID=670386 RepID=D3BP33_HETP5|nr:hypothetical protein PPL_09796 [Heterostelium album PN500]EFA77043.1 hypothetical protein PPL_09796 [Heterostelium album PN500]|eukprot:XP_020429173.1 hypothetical protein PPL_09796 [Heterostelium album PN500]
MNRITIILIVLLGFDFLYSKAFTIQSMSPMIAYRGGNNKFRIVSSDFPVANPPTLKVVNAGKETIFDSFQQVYPGTFEWIVPSLPVSNLQNQKRTNTEIGTVKFIFQLQGSTSNFFEQDFEYVGMYLSIFHSFRKFIKINIQIKEPSIMISPEQVYTDVVGLEMIMSGNHLRLNSFDQQPEVIFDDTTSVNIKSIDNNQIICDIPVSNTPKISTIKIRFYTGLEIDARRNLKYILPITKSVIPDSVASGVSKRISIFGFEIVQLTSTPTVRIAQQDCLNVIHQNGILSCDSPKINIPSGTLQEFVIEIDFNGISISSVKLTIYHPEIQNVNPPQSLRNGGDTIDIFGKYLQDIESISIGTSICNLIHGSFSRNQFNDKISCITSRYDLGGSSEQDLDFNVVIDGKVFSPLNNFKFKYHSLQINKIIPNPVVNPGLQNIQVQGRFGQNSNVQVGQTHFTPIIISTNTITFQLDTKNHATGSYPVTIIDNGITSNILNINIGEGTFVGINIDRGHSKSYTPVSIQVHNFPEVDQEILDDVISFKIGNQYCEYLERSSINLFTCSIPPREVSNQPISFSIKGQTVDTTKVFSFVEPSVTQVSRTNTNPTGGGNFDIIGVNLDLVTLIRFGSIEIQSSSCTLNRQTKLTCQIPRYKSGSYGITLIVKSNDDEYSYPSNFKIDYVGPKIDKLIPIQGFEKTIQTLTIVGTSFGTVSGQVSISVGSSSCKIQKITNTQVICKMKDLLNYGTHSVTITVNGVSSGDDIVFKSNRLSCLGPPLPDKSNNAVDWWFVYKIHHTNEYLYIDSTMDRLKRLDNLQHTTSTDFSVFSPIEATFNQHSYYYYMFFNDQPEGRDEKGGRSGTFKSKNKRFNTLMPNGHVKGMVFWEDPDANDHINGIHIHHSNPAFPGYTSDDKDEYLEPKDGVKFLGRPDFNQHFFCYTFNHLDDVAEYYLKNDGYLLEKNNVFQNMNRWANDKQDKYPYLYDYLSINYNVLLKTRTQRGTKPESKNQTRLVEDCGTLLTQNIGLENKCWWKKNPIEIGGNLKIQYFMKIGNKDSLFVDAKINNNANLNEYVVMKTSNTKDDSFKRLVDGVDIWTVLAKEMDRKYFVDFFYATKTFQTDISSGVSNVGFLNFPPYLRIPNDDLLLETKSIQFSGYSNEHSKLGIPMYPAYGDQALNAKENYFCFGDSNRHNGQAGRGGGLVCIQHPTLSYQFNRMVRQYNVVDKNNDLTKPNKGNSVDLFCSVTQPIKVQRGQWTNTYEVEVKDFINGNHISKYPREIHEITPNLKNSPPTIDKISAEFPALRTTTKFVAPNGEKSSNAIAPILPSNPPDIKNYVANDLFSLHYIAFDKDVGSICSFDSTLTECTKDKSISSLITEPKYGKPINFPSYFGFLYRSLQNLRTFDLSSNDNFKVLEFTSKFMKNLPNAKRNFYQFMESQSNSNSKSYFEAPFIFGVQKVCEEEIAYYMTLHYIYYQSGALPSSSLIYTIGLNNPNWANGVILAISKKLYNVMSNKQIPNFDKCMNNVFSNLQNIESFPDNHDLVNPTADIIFRRSAKAAWDWMNPNYSNGNGGKGGKLSRIDKDNIIPVHILLETVIKARQNGYILNMSNLRRFIDKQYISEENFKTILVNNYIIPVPSNPIDVNSFNSQIKKKSIMFSKSILNNVEIKNYNQLSPLVQDERVIRSGVQQLISITPKSIRLEDIYSLNSNELSNLENSIDKWITINDQSQAIQTLIINSFNQFENHAIKFIDEINRDLDGNSIDLSTQQTESNQKIISLSSPISIVSITFILESILMSKSTIHSTFGDFEVYYLPKPNFYDGVYGMIISTINSQLCDFQMISESDFQSNNFDMTCPSSGPIITSVNQLNGPTNGGYKITINGIRFNSSMTLSVGEQQCVSTELISNQQIVCQVPKGRGQNNLIQISTQQITFNIQRSKFIFSYDSPTITNIEPEMIKSYGNDIMTIYGSNFGDNIKDIRVLIDDKLDCSPILSISSNSIACLTPNAIGDHRHVTVIVQDQSSRLELGTLKTQSFSFGGPEILKIVPKSGDPTDKVVILGNGFGNEEDSDLPPLLFIGDNQIEIDNFTNNFIEFQLEYETSKQPLIIQSGDQTIQSEFEYYSTIITNINNTEIPTSGGLIQLNGFGLGLSSNEQLVVKLNGIDLDCTSFDLFVECYVPSGYGQSYRLSATINGVELLPNQIISYSKPVINNVIIKNDLIEISGNNFVPIENGFTVTESSQIVLFYDGYTTTFKSFKSSILAECLTTKLPQSIQIIVGGQSSNIYNLI